MRKIEEVITIQETENNSPEDSLFPGCDRTIKITHSKVELDSGLRDALIALLALILAGLTIYGGVFAINQSFKQVVVNERIN